MRGARPPLSGTHAAAYLHPVTDAIRIADIDPADVAICLLNFCNRAGVDLGPAILRKLEAAEQKYPVERVRGRNKKYDEYPEWEGER